MSSGKSLFKQTLIYGIATVLPRMLSFLLVRLYTDYMPTNEYGKVSIIFSFMVFFNVVLSYGMETSFFRFEHGENDLGLKRSSNCIDLPENNSPVGCCLSLAGGQAKGPKVWVGGKAPTVPITRL